MPGLPLSGIVTDRDLRTRLVAPGLSYDTPATEIMSSGVVSVNHNQLVFEAMLAMLRHNVHHLPVLDNLRPVGWWPCPTSSATSRATACSWSASSASSRWTNSPPWCPRCVPASRAWSMATPARR